MNMSMTLADVARRLPRQPALTWDGGMLSYGAFEDSVGRIAASLKTRHGLKAGDHVGLAMENCPEFLQALYGIWRAGLVAVPMNAKLHGKEMAFILTNAECRLCFATSDIADRIAALGNSEGPLPPILTAGSRDFAALLNSDPIRQIESDPTEDAWIFYTSGTTGRPKGAVLTHRNLMFMSLSYHTDIDQVDERDVKIHAAALSHASGLYAVPHIARGSHQVIMKGFEPEAIVEALGRYKSVSMFAAPTMVTRLINYPGISRMDPAGFRTLYFGGAPMYVADLRKAIEVFGARVMQIYGQGESPCTITYVPKHLYADRSLSASEDFLASCGVARTGVAVRVVDEEGRELPPGAIGEVVTKSDCVMRGYWKNPEANAKSLKDGWLWTGDVGAMDDKGFLTLKDRSKDMIISGGSNIYPREIEEVLLRHPAVLETAVVGRPHADWGEEVVAFVVRRPGASVDQQALDQLLLDNIARFKRPKEYRFVEALPKNNYGKIVKTELRDALKAEGRRG